MNQRSFVSSKVFLIVVIMLLALSACTMPASGPDQPQSSDTPTAGAGTPSTSQPGGPSETETVRGLAQVDTIEIVMLESFPVQVQVIARGNLPDGCTTIAESLVERTANNFRVTITTSRPAAAACTEALVPYDEVVSLDVLGLSAGTYSVDVNGTTDTFELTVDNVPPTQEVPTQAAGSASVSGAVWHDLCAVAGGEGDIPEIPSAGCVQLENGDYVANGILEEDEPRLAGVEVSLGQGACPSSGLSTVKTNQEGEFTFSNLVPGTYCVSVQSDSLTNGPILIPGRWSAPQSDTAETTVELAADQAKRGVFFGWDYANQPEPDEVQDETSCTNKAAFVEDVNYPDDTQVAGGAAFEKTWKMRNDGTCTWNNAYTVVFMDGDQMGATSPQPLPMQVEPGDEIDLSVLFTAPTRAGTYRSEWMLRSAFGTEFGIGSRADRPFWVQIQVTQSTADLGLGEPTWRESFDNSARWYLYDNGNTALSIDNGQMEMLSRNPGSFDEWGLSNYGSISDFYMEAEFVTGESCSGLDRYGLLLRSPDPNQGYVFAFSCDGRYRMYGWDGTYNGLVEWTTGSPIKTGPDQTNRMGILMEGDKIQLYANGTLLTELEDSMFDEGSFGLFVAAGNTSNFVTYVEELTLWELND